MPRTPFAAAPGLVAGLALVLVLATASLAQDLPPPPPADAPAWVAPAVGKPVEPQPPNAKGQAPAFAGQTRGPYQPTHVALQVKTYAEGLIKPWGLAFLPDGRLLVSEQAGRLRIIGRDGKVSPPVAGLPAVDDRFGGGLLDVAVDPDFAANGLVYIAYGEPRGEGSGTTVARARLVPIGAGARIEGLQVIFRMQPTVDSVRSFGARLAFGRHGTLFVSLGDRDFDQFRPLVQRLDTDIGKIVRINRDGSIPKDNPYLHVKGARPELWAVGFRNPIGAAVDPKTGELWTDENGPQGGDELNHVRGGRNYGWPVSAMAKSTAAGRSARASPRRPGWNSRSTTGTR